ncbi:MAG: thioesterase family protein [Austwickia sp.]|jgi:hypothetical protein|nr:thioesterase family protein [Austwickia sp.]MBK8437623.1 thioesterase family protein [Austwickia sp.]MBK9102929.1 thioesterase family protein [Austwickia sp.]
MSAARPFDNPAGLATDTAAYYTALGGGRYQPTIHTQGAWQPIEQHMAPVSGLLVHAVELNHPREDLQPARLAFEILGMIPAETSTVTTEVVRPGRTIELVEATMTVAGRAVVRALIWRLSRQDTQVVAGGTWEEHDPPMPDPADLPPWQGSDVWSGGYIASLDFRADPGNRPGRGRAWARTPYPLVDGEPVSDLARYVGLVDTANGVATRVDPTGWMYPNVDLSIHLYRLPRMAGPRDWVGFDTRVVFGEGGLGLTSTRLYDASGSVGQSAQMLTVRALATPDHG